MALYEEKKSDVNIAVHILKDAFLSDAECFILVSNDSDLAESLKVIKEEL
jgi:uncharacterized LabA/DUF88 family protein